jgi:XTP/dITP diphosphohydrolase
MQSIILATHNHNKVKELKQFLVHHTHESIQALKQKIEFHTAENYAMPEEPFETFVENALHKARWISKLSGLPTIADDSGLCVPQLNNLPGVKSARFYETQNINKNDIDVEIEKTTNIDLLNNQLLAKLLPQEGFKAYYVANLVYVQHHQDPNPIVVQGFWHGFVKPNFQGDGGFGYDPMFYPLIGDNKVSVAQLPLEIKNQYSHRTQAFQELLMRLSDV